MIFLLFTVACRSAENGPCANDSDCDVGLVCEQASAALTCVAQKVRDDRKEAERVAKEAPMESGARARIVETLNMAPEEAARLEVSAHDDWAFIRDPGVMCFWVQRKTETFEVVKSAPAGATIEPLPGGSVFTLANLRCM